MSRMGWGLTLVLAAASALFFVLAAEVGHSTDANGSISAALLIGSAVFALLLAFAVIGVSAYQNGRRKIAKAERNAHRLKLSAEQVALMNEVLAQSPPGVRATAARIANGQVVPDADADAVVRALASAMLASENFDGEELTGRGAEIDGFIGIVQQMSEHFYD